MVDSLVLAVVTYNETAVLTHVHKPALFCFSRALRSHHSLVSDTRSPGAHTKHGPVFASLLKGELSKLMGQGRREEADEGRWIRSGVKQDSDNSCQRVMITKSNVSQNGHHTRQHHSPKPQDEQEESVWRSGLVNLTLSTWVTEAKVYARPCLGSWLDR